MSIADWLLNPAGLTPHGFCLSWAPGLIWLHAGSDAVIGLAYFSVPLALASFARQRRDLQYNWVLYLFVGFILLCGTTHLMSIVTLWIPSYGIEGIIKLMTALASIGTAIVLWPLIPRLVALPSPSQLESLNAELKKNILAQHRTADLLKASEARVRAANLELERRVDDKTAELTKANAELTVALEHRGILVREVYHRVKNNLQIIDALLTVQSQQISDKDAAAALVNLRRRVHALGLVHQQLMESKDLKTFDIAPFMRELSDSIVAALADSGVTVSVHSIPLTVDLDFAIPLGLLVTELLTISVRHAFPFGEGNIAVVLQRGEDRKLALIVSDDGQETIDGQINVFAPRDVRASGLGARIIAGLVAQLGGTLIMQSENGTRTEIRIAEPALS